MPAWNCSAHLLTLSILLGLPHTAGAQFYQVVDLGTLGGNESHANGINNAGQVVGSSLTGTFSTQATLWNGTTATDLGNPSTFSDAAGINNAGEVVGSYSGGTPHFRFALHWDTNTTIPTELGTLGPGPHDQISYATGINSAGQVVGTSLTDNLVYHAVLWNDTTTPTDLGPGASGGTASYANGINNAGQVVGYAYTADFAATHATLWNGTTAVDLNTQISPALARYITLTSAAAINDNGWIAADGIDSRTGRTEAYLLTPNSVPFASFTPRLTIATETEPYRSFSFVARLALGAKSKVFDPGAEVVSLKIGAVSLTIPAGSFKPNGRGGFAFNGLIGGVKVLAHIQPKVAKKYQVCIRGRDISLTGLPNPVPVTLALGNNTGTDSVTATFTEGPEDCRRDDSESGDDFEGD